MITLVEPADALSHLNLDFFDTSYLNLKIAAASAIVMKRLKLTDYPDDWADDLDASPITYTVPADIHDCTLLVLGVLWNEREGGGAKEIEDVLQLFLTGHRDPTLA